jgi:hypothetical protein
MGKPKNKFNNWNNVSFEKIWSAYFIDFKYALNTRDEEDISLNEMLFFKTQSNSKHHTSIESESTQLYQPANSTRNTISIRCLSKLHNLKM